jgi:hypothetical protein
MKTIHLIYACLLTLMISCSFAQEPKDSKGKEICQVRNVTGFSEIYVSEDIKVNLNQGDREFVEVIAKDDIINEVLTEKHGNELKIHMKGNNYHNVKVTVNVVAIKIESLTVDSDASLFTEKEINSEKLRLEVSSDATLNVLFKASEVYCKASSDGSAKLKGEVENFTVEANSDANINAKEVKAVNVKADVSSDADIKVNVSGNFKAYANSDGSIEYSGNPKTKDIDKSSDGSVCKE